MEARDRPPPGAWTALVLLLAINLFNYIDRQVLAAVEPQIRETFFAVSDRNAMAITGVLGTAFLVTYMLAAPALGWLSDRFSRWIIIGLAVIVWSLASGASGLAATFSALLITRIFVGIGEGGYGPAAPTVLADLFSLKVRGRVMAAFCAAIPVGSALGYVLGGWISEHLGWRWAFYLVTPPGLLLGALCFTQRDPRARGLARPERQRATLQDYLTLIRTRSYVLNCVAQTALTFAIGGIGFWVAAYLKFRGQPASATKFFGVIIVVAGLTSTLLGGWLGDRFRKRWPGSYFIVSALGMVFAFPLFVVFLFTPFPAAWFLMFASVFFMFLNTGPSNTALANVTLPKVRASAFALNILIIHLFGDAAAFPTIGFIAGHTNMTIAFLFVSVVMLIGAVAWFVGVKYLPGDTARVEAASV
jgi:predicted MFS family arabinose efflux permease